MVSNKIINGAVFLLIAVMFCIDVSCKRLLCQQEENKQLCEKIGQMLLIGFGGFKQDDTGKVLWNDKNSTRFKENSRIARHITTNHIGGIVLFLKPVRNVKTGEFIRDRNIVNPQQVAKLNQDLQEYNSKIRKKQKLAAVPLFIGVDQEGGRVDRLPANQGFPVATLLPQSFGAKEDIKETYIYAIELARELSDAHFNLNFAPVVDVNINPTNPIIGGLGRSFSADPHVVVDQAKQFIKAFTENRIIPVLKHFPGHGSSLKDSHVGLVDVTDTYQKDKELYPYVNLIRNGFDGMIMTTHVINGRIDQSQCKTGLNTDHATWCPGTMSKVTLTKLLKDTMGYKGIIISDDMTMGAIAKEYPLSKALKEGINAGVDIFIVANNDKDQTDEVINTIVQLVKNGEIERRKIDEIYDRILNFKKKNLN